MSDWQVAATDEVPQPVTGPIVDPKAPIVRSPGSTDKKSDRLQPDAPFPTVSSCLTAPGASRTPSFAEPPPTPDPTKFTAKHGSDAKAYKILDSLRGTLQHRPFPVVSGTDEPILRLEEAYGVG
jgi:hypothetical protein